MPLSTSNSNARIPPRPWHKVWLTAVIILIFLMGGMEVIVRAKGYLPSVRADSPLWALVRSTMPPEELDTVALVGSSRMLCAVNLDVFEEEYGVKPVQLALIHSSPVPILEDLANDPEFRGLIICELTPALFFSDEAVDLVIAQKALGTRDAMDNAIFDYWETRSLTFIQSNMVSQSGQLQLEDILIALVTGNWPEAIHTIRSDRSRFFDTTKTERRLPVFPKPGGPEKGIELSEFEIETIEEVREYVERIRSRGGDLVFVYLPCRGPNKYEEILHHPRELYFDGVLEATGTFGIHINDYDAISHLLPIVDYSHLDIEQAKLYTRELARILKSEYKRAVSPGE